MILYVALTVFSSLLEKATAVSIKSKTIAEAETLKNKQIFHENLKCKQTKHKHLIYGRSKKVTLRVNTRLLKIPSWNFRFLTSPTDE